MSEFEEMRETEERLRVELGRVDAPAGFAERVMLRVAAQPERARMHGRIWMYATAAMILLSVTVGERVWQERQQARANAEFETAMQVTNRAMEHAEEQAREQMQRAGVDLDERSNQGDKQ